MTYLLLSIFCSFLNTFLIKMNETHGVNTTVVIAANYISAALLGWSLLLWEGIPGLDPVTLVLGFGGGLLWPSTFLLLMRGIREYGLSLAGSAARLSLLVPVLFALLFLKEPLSWKTALGILAALAALMLISPLKKAQTGELDMSAFWFFPLMVFSLGCVTLWVNLFNTFGPAPQHFVFITLVFSFSLGWSWTYLLLRGIRVRKGAVGRGFFLGFSNFGMLYFLLESLRHPDFENASMIVYTLHSVMSIVLAGMAGVLVWKEPLNRFNYYGIVCAMLAVVLLNLRG